MPFRIEDVPTSKTLEYFISAAHWQDALTHPLEPHVARLAETIRFILANRDSTQVPPPLHRHSGARLGDAEGQVAGTAAPRPIPPLVPPHYPLNPLKRPAAAILLVAAVAAAIYGFVLRKAPPKITAVTFPPVVAAGTTNAVGTVQFETGADDLAEAQFAVVSAESFQPFTVRPPVKDQESGSFQFSIRASTVQHVTLKTTLVDVRGRRSKPVSFSFEVRKPAAAPKSTSPIEINLPQGLKLKIPH